MFECLFSKLFFFFGIYVAPSIETINLWYQRLAVFNITPEDDVYGKFEAFKSLSKQDVTRSSDDGAIFFCESRRTFNATLAIFDEITIF